jgi:hypothetical protein
MQTLQGKLSSTRALILSITYTKENMGALRKMRGLLDQQEAAAQAATQQVGGGGVCPSRGWGADQVCAHQVRTPPWAARLLRAGAAPWAATRWLGKAGAVRGC